ncbi:MAG TPA: ankyrin repeat domain-containing protein [Limnobacter sp.]|uniref:ankyrin repeat domain-containing protein n=1 Tax=Limnobacter sp. TaxID=2003368 RepID=UPI002EDA6F9C
MSPSISRSQSPARQAALVLTDAQNTGNAAGSSNEPNGRLAQFKTGLNAWVNQATGAERSGRLEGARRIQNYLDKNETRPHLDLSGLALTTLPNDYRVLAQLATLRGAVQGAGVINISGNPLDTVTQASLLTLTPREQGLLYGQLSANGPAGSVAWVSNLTNVVDVLQEHAMPGLAALAQQCPKVFQTPIPTLSQAVNTYNELRVKTQAKIDCSTAKGFNLSPMTDLNLVDHLGGLERLHHLAHELKEAGKAMADAKPKLLSTQKDLQKGRERLVQMGGLCRTTEQLLMALHEWPAEAEDTLKQVDQLDKALGDLHLRSLKAEAQGVQVDTALNSLVDLLIQHTSGLAKAYTALNKQLNNYQTLMNALPSHWPLKAELRHWLEGKAEAMAMLKQHKDFALMLGRLAKPALNSDQHAFLYTQLADRLPTLPADSPYRTLLAKHPDAQVRGLVPHTANNVVAEVTEPTQPAETSLRRSPSEELLAQFKAVDVTPTSLAKVRYADAAFAAVKQGDLAQLHELLCRGLPSDIVNADGETLLHAAATHGQITVLRWLAKVQKLPMDSRDKLERTALLSAASAGQVQAMAALVDAGANVNAADADSSRAIHLAAQFGDVPTLAYCVNELKHGLEEKSSFRQTPLLLAAAGGKVGNVRWLVQQGANVNATDLFSRKAIHWAAQCGDVPTLAYCVNELKHGLEEKGFNGRTPLLHAATGGKVGNVRWLVQRGANVNAADADSCKAIHLAAQFGDVPTLAYCVNELKHGLEEKGFNGQTPLLHAADDGKVDAMRWLVQRGANIQARDDSGRGLETIIQGKQNPDLTAYLAELSDASKQGQQPVASNVFQRIARTFG